jgi:hypothetical protein
VRIDPEAHPTCRRKFQFLRDLHEHVGIVLQPSA